MVESTFALRLPGAKMQVFLGFDSDPDASKSAERIAEYIRSCGERTIAHYPRQRNVPPPSVIVIVLNAGPDVPDEVQQTVQVGNSRCTIKAKILRVDSMSLDDMLGTGLMVLLPFYPSRFEDKFDKMEADPRRRRKFVADIQRIVDRLKDEFADEPADSDASGESSRVLLISTAQILQSELQDFPQTKAAIDEIFDEVLTEEEKQRVLNFEAELGDS